MIGTSRCFVRRVALLALIVPLVSAVLSPQLIVAVVPRSVALHDAGLSTGPENGTVAWAVIVLSKANAAGATISATDATTPTDNAMRRTKQRLVPLM